VVDYHRQRRETCFHTSAASATSPSGLGLQRSCLQPGFLMLEKE